MRFRVIRAPIGMTKILVVDDNAIDRKLMSALLERNQGWIVETANDGEEAMMMLDDHEIDLVVTDLQMPKMDGLALVKNVRTRFNRVPVVLVTASFGVSAAIVLEASLSFLGLGIQPPVPTWGGLLADAREHVHRAWWLALYPGAAVFLAVLACNLVGEGLRDLLDPRSGSR